MHSVNDYHASYESQYKSRWIRGLLQEAVTEHPVVVMTGARQVGKSTFLQHERPFSRWTYHTLDDLNTLAQAQKDPSSLWAGQETIVLDEVQKAPALLSHIKQVVDRKRTAIRFVLSGSANLLLMKQVSESLAGRAIYFTMLPMSLGETEGKRPPEWFLELLQGNLESLKEVAFSRIKRSRLLDPVPHMLRGFMPPLLTLSGMRSVLQWWEGYVATYLERDLRHISQIDSLPDFHRVMQALALRSGQILNQTEVSRDTGVSQPTVHRYVSLLETMCLLERLPAFARNRTSRLLKSPKVYWVDPGLASFLAGYYAPETLKASREAGGIFEGLCLLHLRILSQLVLPHPRIHYWRTTTGREVDFVLEHGRTLLPIEIKMTSSPSFKDTEGIRLFMEEYPEAQVGLLIHTGNKAGYLSQKIVAVPWTLVAS